jgi:hypothetical protein
LNGYVLLGTDEQELCRLMARLNWAKVGDFYCEMQQSGGKDIALCGRDMKHPAF